MSYEGLDGGLGKRVMELVEKLISRAGEHYGLRICR